MWAESAVSPAMCVCVCDHSSPLPYVVRVALTFCISPFLSFHPFYLSLSLSLSLSLFLSFSLYRLTATGSDDSQSMTLRLAYAMALTRFVNGVVDASQKVTIDMTKVYVCVYVYV